MYHTVSQTKKPEGVTAAIHQMVMMSPANKETAFTERLAYISRLSDRMNLAINGLENARDKNDLENIQYWRKRISNLQPEYCAFCA